MQNNSESKKFFGKVTSFVAVLLLLAIMLVGAFGVTSAKYITSVTDNRSGEVADWGFTVKVDMENWISDAWVKGTANSTSTVTTTKNGYTIKASSDNNVVAPGATGYMTISVTGTAEVLSALTIATTDNDLKVPTLVASYKASTAGTASGDSTEVTYYPILFTLQSSTDGSTWTNAASGYKLSTVLDTVEGASKTAIEPNSTLSLYYKLSWAWVFEQEAQTDQVTGTWSENDANALDTVLGAYAADSSNNATGYITNYGGTNEKTWTVTAASTVTAFNMNLTIKLEQIIADKT